MKNTHILVNFKLLFKNSLHASHANNYNIAMFLQKKKMILPAFKKINSETNAYFKN